jgi:Flp pilus assembly pilin Flp
MRSSLYSLAKRFTREERGASFTEYAMLVGIVAIGASVLLTAFLGDINTTFTAIGAALIAATP